MRHIDFDTGNQGQVSTLFVPFTDLFSVWCQVAARRRNNSQPLPPIYEEMVGVQPPGQKLPKNSSGRKTAPENHYESPSGALFPRIESQK